MGSTRLEVVRHATTHPNTRALYARVFGRPPPFEDRTRFPERAGPFGDREARAAWSRMRALDRVGVDRAFANVGKAIAAYERLLRPGETRFDRFVASSMASPCAETGEAELSGTELRGLRLFLDEERTLCLRCHNGPLLSNQSFHQVATEIGAGGQPEFGRFLGIQAILVDPFNCLGRYSDAAASDCAPLRFLNRDHVAAETGKFRTPTLRGLPRTAPYMHDGRFATLAEVIEHYRNPPMEAGRRHELLPLDLDPEEVEALAAFLETLDGPVDAGADWLNPPGELRAQP
jgi:cytochrome c peroxidase